MKAIIITLLLMGVLVVQDSRGARILAMFPYNAKSHFSMFETLLKGLAARGHEVVVLSHFPQKKPVPNYTDINVYGTLPEIIDCMDLDLIDSLDVVSFLHLIIEEQIDMCNIVLNHTNVQALLKSEQKFDLIINEVFAADCFLGFVHKFKAPLMSVISSVPLPWANDLVANPAHPAYVSNYFLPYTDRMTFMQRLENTFYVLYAHWAYYYYSYVPSHKIARRAFGDDLPPLEDIARSTNLILVNTHFSLNQPRPMVPAYVEVGGLHVKKAKDLPKELDGFISEAKHGVIFFSLGSMVRADSIDKDKVSALLGAFSELPQRVLWRCNGTTLNVLPPNVRVQSWLPQRDVLGHPNVRLFITHGGLMGTQEAVYSGVPMVAIPMFGDQFLNIDNYVSKGIAVKLNYKDITKENVLKALKTVLEDKRYEENAKRMSLLFRDRPQTALDTAIFWTEYVIKHGGAPHLRSAAVNMPWYQYLLLDVIAVVTLASIVTFTTLYVVLRKLFCVLCQRFCNRHSTKLKKQ